MRVFASGLLCLLCLLGPAPAQQPPDADPSWKKPMGFRVVTDDPDAPADRQRRWVVASGTLTPDTPHVFEWFLNAHDVAGLTIWFDSPGGSILGGIRLGDALRKARARVAIGRSTAVGEQAGAEGRLPRHQLIPARGVCYSSCAYAFLGGVSRRIHPGAAYGVHMFWPGEHLEGMLTRSYAYADIERAQRISANLAAYIQRVGGDLQLLQLAASTPPRGAVRRLSAREIVALQVASLELGETVLAGPGRWGVAFDRRQARLVTSAEAAGPEDAPLSYALEIACSAHPGFHEARFEMAPRRELPRTRPLAFRRLLLASNRHDGVLAASDKDIVALPPSFARRASVDPRQWIGAAGAVPEAIVQEAARPAGTLRVRVDDGTEAQWELPVPTGNLPKAFETWSAACARIARGGDALP